jgi:hypothetical protein
MVMVSCSCWRPEAAGVLKLLASYSCWRPELLASCSCWRPAAAGCPAAAGVLLLLTSLQLLLISGPGNETVLNKVQRHMIYEIDKIGVKNL